MPSAGMCLITWKATAALAFSRVYVCVSLQMTVVWSSDSNEEDDSLHLKYEAKRG